MSYEMIPSQSREVGIRLSSVLASAHELSSFADSDAALASRAGVEVLALEAKILSSDPALGRLGSRTMSGADLSKLERLEGVVALSSQRMGECVASMDAEASQRTVNNLSQIVGMAGGAIGLAKSLGLF